MSSGESIQEELLRRVEENRQLGKYPVGLEEQLEAQFAAIMEVVHGRDNQLFIGVPEVEHLGQMVGALEERLEDVQSSEDFSKMSEDNPASQLLIELSELTCEALKKCLILVQSMEAEVRKIREEDTRVLRKMNHMILDRLVMVDVLAQAVVDLERRIAEE